MSRTDHAAEARDALARVLSDSLTEKARRERANVATFDQAAPYMQATARMQADAVIAHMLSPEPVEAGARADFDDSENGADWETVHPAYRLAYEGDGLALPWTGQIKREARTT